MPRAKRTDVPRKPRKESTTERLAKRFVTEIRGEAFDYRLHGRVLADAKRLINPKEGEPFDPDYVWGCLLALREGVFEYDGPIDQLWVVTYGKPTAFYQQYVEWQAVPPPFYNLPEIALWERITGKCYTDAAQNVIVSVPERSEIPSLGRRT